MRFNAERLSLRPPRSRLLKVGAALGVLAGLAIPALSRDHDETVRDNLVEGLSRARSGEFSDECSNRMPPEPFSTDRLLSYHNFVRNQMGLGALTIATELQQSAQATAEYLAEHDNLEHPKVDIAGLKLAKSLVPAGWIVLGENISSSEEEENEAEVMQCWIESKGHFENIARPEFNSVGFGYSMAHDGTEYIVVHFGGIEK